MPLALKLSVQISHPDNSMQLSKTARTCLRVHTMSLIITQECTYPGTWFETCREYNNARQTNNDIGHKSQHEGQHNVFTDQHRWMVLFVQVVTLKLHISIITACWRSLDLSLLIIGKIILWLPADFQARRMWGRHQTNSIPTDADSSPSGEWIWLWTAE